MSRTRLVLSSRITLAAGQSLVDTDVYVPATFAFDTELCAVAVLGHCATIRNVTIKTYATEFLTGWMDDPSVPASGVGIPWTMCGIRANAVKSLTMENVHVEGFPQGGFQGYQLEDLVVKRFSATKCFTGFTGSWVTSVNKRARVNGLTVYDTWGPPDGIWPGAAGWPSTKRPGYFIGGAGMSGYFDDFSFSNLDFHGELSGGFKMVRSKRGEVLRCKSNEMFLQGTDARTENTDHTTDGSEDVIYRDCDLNKDYCVGENTSGANGVQISFNVSRFQLLNTTLVCGNHDGHGIEVSGGVSAIVSGCTVTGFNQKRGNDPAYAVHINDASSLNADLLTANNFSGQTRLVLTD